MPESSGKDAEGARVRGFDGLRALSALLVFVEHKIKDLGTGAIGVWVFFALSGYLIVGILQRARRGLESESAGGVAGALADFWRNRAVRILPIYYVTVGVVFVAGVGNDPRALPYYLFYVQNFYIALVSHAWSDITHFWSLAIEQQFYLLAAPVLLLVAARAHRRLLALVLASCVLLTLLAEALAWDGLAVSLLPPANFAFIALGGLAYLERGSALDRWFESRLLLALSGLAFALAFLATRSGYDPFGRTPLSVYFSGLVFSGAAIGWTARHQASKLVRLLELPPLRWLGTISYGFYVYHPLVPGRERVAHLLKADWPLEVPRLLWLVGELSVALMLAHVSYYYFERLFLRLKRRA